MAPLLPVSLRCFALAVVAASASGRNATESESDHCEWPWVYAGYDSVGLDCLLFESVQTMSWAKAWTFCADQSASLLSLGNNEEQLEFVRGHLVALAAQERSHLWWIAATDMGHKGQWTWQDSCENATEHIMWYEGLGPSRHDMNCACFGRHYDHDGVYYSLLGRLL